MDLDFMIDLAAQEAYGMTVSEAKRAQVCICCKQSVVDSDGFLSRDMFSTPEGKREYFISGMCELCWDKEFSEEEAPE